MEFPGWTSKDFEVFHIAGFEERMDAIRERIQPKLDALGQDVAPFLEEETGTEWFHHVAKHMRRSVNPPADTWVALNRVKRGYKATVHFSCGLSGRGANVAVVVKPECIERDVFADGLQHNAAALVRRFREEEGLFIGDVPNAPKPDLQAAAGATEADWVAHAARLLRNKSYEFEAGYRLEPEEVSGWDGERFVREALERMRAMLPLYKGGVLPGYTLKER
jgi:uncharacterized protein YktB (UPF0637 family)